MNWIDSKIVAFDFETSGEITGTDDQGRPTSEYALQPWRVRQGKAWPTSLVWTRIYNGKAEVQGGLMPTAETMRAFLEEAIETDSYVLGWNTVFDIAWLLAHGLDDLVMQVKWLDGMLLWRHYFIEPEYEMSRPNKMSYGLKKAVEKYLPVYSGYEENVDFHDPSPEARTRLHKYNKRDVLFTLLISKHLYEMLDPRQRQAALIEAECLPLVAQANLNGMMVDTLQAHELQARLDKTSAEMLAKLAPHGVTEQIVRSPLKLSALMFDEWKLPVFKTNTSKLTGKVSRSTDKEVLHELAFVDDRARDLRSYREALGNRAKFADAPLASVDYNGDGRSHPGAIVFGTYSGRLTYASKQGKNKYERQTGFALHQEKRGPEFRGIIVAPPGYTLMEFDASGQEYRWMAVASGDPTMLGLCEVGEDPHSFMGARFVGRDYRDLIALVEQEDAYAKDDRQLGKVGNLSLQYRTSAKKLRVVARVQYNIPMELPQAERIHRTYQQAYPGVPRYWEKQIAQTKRLGYVETFAGRRVQVVGDWTGKMGWSMGSTAINYRIQGTGAEQKYLAMMLLKPVLAQHGAYFAWDLHDGIYLYVPDDKVAQMAVSIKQLLDNMPYQEAWGFTPPIPMPWDCKTGKSWGALKNWKFD